MTMEGITMKLMALGAVTLVALSGIMGILVVNYVKSLLKKIDDMSQVAPLLKKVNQLVDKVEKIFISLEVTRETTALEVNQLKERVSKLEATIEKLKLERGK